MALIEATHGNFIRPADIEVDDCVVSHVSSNGKTASNLGLRVIAEGVESDAAWTQLEEFGCDLSQGYLLSRPVPADELTTWLVMRDPYGAVPLPT